MSTITKSDFTLISEDVITISSQPMGKYRPRLMAFNGKIVPIDNPNSKFRLLCPDSTPLAVMSYLELQNLYNQAIDNLQL